MKTIYYETPSVRVEFEGGKIRPFLMTALKDKAAKIIIGDAVSRNSARALMSQACLRLDMTGQVRCMWSETTAQGVVCTLFYVNAVTDGGR